MKAIRPSATSSPVISRRRFAKATLAASAALGFPALLSARNPNDKLSVAIIGSGGRGGANMGGVAQTEYIAALCDVNQRNLDAAKAKHPQAATFTDFRKIFDHAKDYDAVVVSTCEHTHAFATLPALRLGKHVYCEKPLTYNIWEARVIREAAAKDHIAAMAALRKGGVGVMRPNFGLDKARYVAAMRGSSLNPAMLLVVEEELVGIALRLVMQ